MIRVVVPDTHGKMVDVPAWRALVADLKWLAPKQIVKLGDHVDVGGVFSSHPRSYVDELAYSYEDDCAAAERHLDDIQKAAPGAEVHYLEGNHEAHLERWVARTFYNRADAENVRRCLAPEYKLRLKDRGIRYYRQSDKYMGISIPGTIKLGRCLFTHGSRVGKHATSAMLDDFGANVVHGHTHRAQYIARRTVASGEIMAACPGTLSVLQPLWLHSSVSAWSHGYGLQFVERDGRFLHINVPIARGKSMLKPLLNQLKPRSLAA